MKAKKAVLSNGLRLITIPMKESSAVVVYILVEAGSKYESKKQNGISHFLEHMCFKGTEKRLNAYLINSELDSIGAQTNAFTSHEFTGYYAKAHSTHLTKIIDVLSDLYLNSVFPAEEVEKEKGVVVEEINMYEDLPQKKVRSLFQSLVYGDQPVGRDVIGTKDIVQSLTPKDFLNYRKEHYVASSTIVVVAGKFNEIKARKLVQNAFINIPKTKKTPKKKVIERQKTPQCIVFPKVSEQTHIVLGFRAFSARDKRATALAVLVAILGEGMSSRLFQKLREDLGICYYIKASFDEYTDHGGLTISSGVDPNRSVEAVEVILSELKNIRDGEISESEIMKAKEYMISAMYLGLETSDSLAGYYGFDEIIRGGIKSPQDVEKEIRRVSVKDVQKVARDIFNNRGLNLAMVGKVPSKAKISRILKI